MIPLTEPIHFVLAAIAMLGSGLVGFMIGHGRGWKAAYNWLGHWHGWTMVRLLQRGIIDDKFDKTYTDQMWACHDDAHRKWGS